MNKKYSYIIPFYKVRPYVKDCLDSVLAQTYSNWECICIDDGSPDGLGEILDQYAAKDARFKVVHQANAGVGAARNTGLDLAQGDWIVFLDGDDVVAPWHLSVCNMGMEQFPLADMIAFERTKFDETATCDWSNGPGVVAFKSRDRFDIVDEWYNGGGHWMRAYRRTVFGHIRFNSIVRGQDLMYLEECVYMGRPLARCGCPCVGYRIRMGSTVHSKISAAKLRATLCYEGRVFELIETTQMKVSSSIVRMHLNQVTETFCGELAALGDRGEHFALVCEWVELLQKLRVHRHGNTFQRLRLWILTLTHGGMFSRWLLCVLPYELKLHGVHR